MRKLLFALALCVALGVSGVAGTAPGKGATITVRVLTAKVMKQPKFIGGSLASVARGDQLTFVEAQRDWYKVSTRAGAQGWIHKGNVTDKAVQLSSKPGSAAGASQEEIELAGRGFTPEVEEEYRRKHGDMDFSHVDAIEGLSVDADALATFAAEGKVGL
jgi:SH3 domain-containing protein